MSFCTNCGMELNADVNFCTACGIAVDGDRSRNTSHSTQTEQRASGRLLMSLKPRFVSKLAYLRSIPIVLFGGFFISFFAGPLVMSVVGFILSFFVGDLGYVLGGLFYLVLLIIGGPMLFRRYMKRLYEEIEYKIYDDKVEYAEGFWNVTNNMARLSKVVDVHLKQGFLQQKFGLGTVVIDLPGGGSRNAVKLSDLKESEKVYKELQDLLADRDTS